MARSSETNGSWLPSRRGERSTRAWGGFVLLQCLCACGTPEPKAVVTEDGRAALELPYCLDATQCFVKADETCPRGYDVVRWQASRPHIVICR